MNVRSLPCLLLLTAITLLCSMCAPSEQGPPLSSEQKLQLDTLRGQLTDPQRQPQTRQEAARLLLSQSYPQARHALKAILADSSQPVAQVAVANAIADAGNAPTEFIDPLLEMVTGDNPGVRPAAARALVTYQNHGVTDRLIAIARDRKQPREVRLDVIHSLRRIVAKTSVRALIDLLNDPSPQVRTAAAESLTRLTNIRSYGDDRQLWEAWWTRNRDKTRAEWLVELADSLTRAQMAMESENRQLRTRLVNVMTDLYNVSPKTQRSAMLLEMYASDVADIRLLAGRLTDKMIATNEPVGPDLRQRVRVALEDDDPRVRELAAILEASLPDEATPKLLMDRLDAETSPAVRAGVLKALGQLRTAEAIPAILRELASRDDTEAIAAAEALARVVAEHPLQGDARADAAEALTQRYATAVASANSEKLREALLRAMGIVGEPSVAPVLIEALKDPAGTIRLAAVTGLTRLNAASAVTAIEPLMADTDRGVRQASLAAIATLGGQEYLPQLLARTDPTVEADAAVRKQAWDEVIKLCSGADADALNRTLDALKLRDDADAQRINIMQMRVQALRDSESAELPTALMQLAAALREAGRASEAVPHAAEAYALTAAEAAPDAKQPGDALKAAWRLYVGTMLDANDPAYAKIIAERPAEDPAGLTAEAVDMLFGRLAALREQDDHLAVIALCDAALTQLTDRLTTNRRQQLRAMLTGALAAQAELDRQAVAALLPALQATDVAARSDAENRLKTMGDRAVRPLVEQLEKLLAGETPDLKVEAVIVETLRQIAPKLGAYDREANLDQKRQTVRGWLGQL